MASAWAIVRLGSKRLRERMRLGYPPAKGKRRDHIVLPLYCELLQTTAQYSAQLKRSTHVTPWQPLALAFIPAR